MMTGFFADTKTGTKVHLVNNNNKPMCKAKIGKNKEFQWNANGIQIEFIECEK